MGLFDTLLGSSGEADADAERAKLMAQSQANLDKALAQWEGVEIPQLEKLKLQMQYPELVGTLQAEQLGPSLLGEIETDPRLREAQMKALSELQTMSSEGLTPEQESMFADLKEQGLMERKSKEADIMASLERRGLVGGEGSAARSEMLMKQQSSQSVANEEARAARKMAAEQAAAMRSATMQSGQLAGQMDAQDYQRAAQAEQARAAIEAANASNRQNVASQNLTAAQQIANDRINLANQKELTEQGYNIQIPQQNFANQTAMAGAKAGIYTGQAGLAAQQAANVKPQKSGGLLPGLASAGGAALAGYFTAGNPAAMAFGAQAGGAVGSGLSSSFQSKEDGGVIENSKPTTGNLKQVYADKPKEKESEIKRLTKLLGAVDKYAEGGEVKKQLPASTLNSILQSAMVPEEEQRFTPFEGALTGSPTEANVAPTTSPDAKIMGVDEMDYDSAIADKLSGLRGMQDDTAEKRDLASKLNADRRDITPEERDALFDASEESVDENTTTTVEPDKKEMSKKDVASYAQMAGSIMGALSQAKKREYDDGWRAPVIRSADFAPQSISVPSPLKMEYGGVVPSMKGFANTSTNGNAYTSNGSVEDINTAYKTSDPTYFRKSAIESYSKLRTSPVGNMNDVIGLKSIPLPSGTDQMFAEGGLPGKLSTRQQKDALALLKDAEKAASHVPSDEMAPMRKLMDEKRQKQLVDVVGERMGKMGTDPAKRSALVKLLENADLKRLGKVSKKVGKSLPGIGALIGVGSALATGDASAAVPVLDEAESLGPKQGTLDYKLESGERLSPAEQEIIKRRMQEAQAKMAGGEYACGGRVKHYEDGGRPVEGYDSDMDEELIDGTSYVGDRVDAKVNSGEMVLNVDQQQRLMDLLRGDIAPEEMPNEDVVRPAEEDETNLHEKNEELEARLSAIEGLLKRGV